MPSLTTSIEDNSVFANPSIPPHVLIPVAAANYLLIGLDDREQVPYHSLIFNLSVFNGYLSVTDGSISK